MVTSWWNMLDVFQKESRACQSIREPFGYLPIPAWTLMIVGPKEEFNVQMQEYAVQTQSSVGCIRIVCIWVDKRSNTKEGR